MPPSQNLSTLGTVPAVSQICRALLSLFRNSCLPQLHLLAQWQPLPVTLGKMQEEVERRLRMMSHNGIHNLLQHTQGTEGPFMATPTTTVI